MSDLNGELLGEQPGESPGIHRVLLILSRRFCRINFESDSSKEIVQKRGLSLKGVA